MLCFFIQDVYFFIFAKLFRFFPIFLDVQLKFENLLYCFLVHLHLIQPFLFKSMAALFLLSLSLFLSQVAMK